MEPKLAYQIAEFARAFGISKDSTRRRIAEGTIRGFKLGRRVLIPASEVDRLLSGTESPRGSVKEILCRKGD